MINSIIKKTILDEKPEEYLELAKIIQTSPVEIYDLKKYTENLTQIIEENVKFIKNKHFAIFHDLKVVSVGEKQYKLPSAEALIAFLNIKYDKATIALLLSEALDIAIINYIREQ